MNLLGQAIDVQIMRYNDGHINRTQLIAELKSLKTLLHSQEIRSLKEKIELLNKEVTKKDILLDKKISELNSITQCGCQSLRSGKDV